MKICIERLALHRARLPQLARWLRREWPQWYGRGGPGNAAADLHAFADGRALPLGVLALADGVPCGLAALKAESIPSHAQLIPWAACGFVLPRCRGQGIGRALLAALESEASALGHAHIYCATASADTLLERAGWRAMDRVEHDGQALAIYRKALLRT